MTKTKKSLSLLVLAIVSLCCFAFFGTTFFASATTTAQNQNLVYQLDFSNESNRMDNKASASTAPDATLTTDGNATFTANAIKGNTALNLKSNGKHVNYVSIPSEVINYDNVTIAGWVNISSNSPQWSRMFEISKGTDGKNCAILMPTFYNKPTERTNRQDFNFKMAVNNNILRQVTNGWQPDSSSDTFSSTVTSADNQIVDDISSTYSNTAWTSTIYDTWHHFAWEFTPTAVKYFVNGQLVGVINETDICAEDLTEHKNSGYTKTFSLSNIYDASLTTFYLGNAYDSTADFTGSFADIRVYNKALTESEINSEYDLSYSDFLTSNFDFENGTVDTVSGVTGALINTASIETDPTLNSKVLKLDGQGKGQSASQMIVDKNLVLGHNNLTVSMDAFINPATGGWARLFDFASSDRQELCLGTRWGGSSKNTLRVKFAKDESTTVYNLDAETTFNRWVNYTVTVKGNVLSIYQDGVLLSENTNFAFHNSVFSGTAVPKASFGGTLFYNDNPLNGYLDNIKIYSVALTPTEIATVHNLNKVTSETIGTPLGDVEFTETAWEHALMETNLDFMMKLDKDRLLYNYRLIAGLDTKGATSYGAWISTESGGAGQFEAHYVVALAKASQTMPNYSYNGETVLQRLTYMVEELKKCQDAFANYNPENAGYLGAIGVEHYYELAKPSGGWNTQVTTTVTKTDGSTYDVVSKIWVPWYFNHKNMEALLDVATYANSSALRETALDMVIKHADWCAKILKTFDSNISTYPDPATCFEYGGMAEVLYQIYSITNDADHAYAAQKFEEKWLLDTWYKNIDTLTTGGNHAGYVGMHANTQIPKVLGAAAGYEATGKEYYYTIVKNAFDMMVARSNAFGGVGMDENFSHEAHEVQTGATACETCCSYNLLKLADYLFRWTNDIKYANYFEKTYTNHILSSMAPDTGLKTYFVSTAFGGHKVYHTQDTTFWCCSCTGMESFAKLPYGIYYNTDDGVIVNMFYSSTYKVSNDLTIKQTGDFYSTQSTKITVEGDGNFKIKLRVPDWAENGFTVKINGTTQTLTAENGYIVIDRVWNNGDYIDYTVPFSIRLEDLNKDGEYKAMFYGPILMVAKFDAVTDDVRTNQTNVASAYTGPITDNITHLNLLEVNARTSNSDGYYKINLTTQNNGTLNFEPFNRVFHNRYGMYFTYTEIADLSELSSKIADAKLLDTSMYVSSSVTAFNTALTNAENITSANTQSEVDNAISDLDNAIASLVLKGDKTALNAKIAEAEDLIETDYTASTWANLQTALTIAKAVSDDVTQDTVDTALNALTTAINNLVEVDDGGDTPGGDNTGDNGSNDNTDGGDNTGDNGNTGGGMSCSMSLGAETFVIGFMALSIGLFLIIKKIKRRNA